MFDKHLRNLATMNLNPQGSSRLLFLYYYMRLFEDKSPSVIAHCCTICLCDLDLDKHRKANDNTKIIGWAINYISHDINHAFLCLAIEHSSKTITKY